MTPTTSGQVITFYSHKGGAGRTMAMANTACLLAAEKKRVLAVDWDFEAPGLHEYFRKHLVERDVEPAGLLGMLCTIRDSVMNSQGDWSESRSFDLLDSLPLGSWVTNTTIENLDVLTAGACADNYRERLSAFSWSQLHRRAPSLFHAIGTMLSSSYDYVLLDSRTGHSDASSICTGIMPEKIILVFTPNRQNLDGLDGLIRDAVHYRKASSDERRLVAYPVPSRVDNSESRLRYEWRHGERRRDFIGYQSLFEDVFSDVYELQTCDLSAYFDEVQLQYVPKYAYGESLPAVFDQWRDRLSLVRSYSHLAKAILDDLPPWDWTRLSTATLDVGELDISVKDDNTAFNQHELMSVLGDGVDAWNNFRELNSSGHFDLSSCDLSGKVLCGANLSCVNLNNAKLSNTDLSSADMTGADLEECDFRYAIVRNSNLSGANLRGANCRHASFTGSTFSRANLVQTQFNNAILDHVNLSYSDCVGAMFIGCILTESDFENAKLSSTAFNNVDLSTVMGLERVVHTGSTAIDIATLTRSDGKIPDTFLRGCGIPEDIIAYKSSFVGSAIEYYSCFISYSHEDKAFARRLHDALQGRGIRCWLDEKQLLPGDDIYEQVDRGIRMWDKTLLCASKHSLTSAWVDNELDHAFAKEKELFRRDRKEVKALIPLNLDGYLFEWQHPKKNLVMERLAPDFTNWKRNSDKFDEQLEQVIKALRTDDGGREPVPVSKL